MTLIRSYQPYLNKKTVKTGVPVVGGAVGQLMASTNQLSKCKVLNRTHISLLYEYFGLNGQALEVDVFGFSFTQADPLNFFIPTSPEATHLAIIFRYYGQSNSDKNIDNVDIKVELFDSSSTLIDIGMDFDYASHLQLSGSGLFAINVQESFTGADQYEPPSGGYSARTTPRPLYIPSANRGENLLIKVTSPYMNFTGLDVLELVVA